ncbi:hypothetical protein FSP39_007729 [Pinctada imbricata]|uniref:NtA domain-containing protein n=1 Tax=Pinctada imbricata TaxID=66713 RepID=A0AA88YGH7_PINIB|nr:hypothetical protein FSP39_007729 [Pinctada imbricata]
MPDFQHIGMYKGEVEIRRVVKGKAKLEKFVNGFEPTSKKEIIMVEGFGDTHICESDVRVKDTRILMLNMGEDGAMKLNSSIIRININNLERIDKAVNGE